MERPELEPWTEYESIVRELRAQLIKMGAVIDEVDALAKSKPRSSLRTRAPRCRYNLRSERPT
jgi:hypothetical protein